MKIYIIILISIIFFTACEKDLESEDVLKNFTLSSDEILADNQTEVNLSVELPDNSSTDRRSVIFSSTDGIFNSSGEDKCTVKAEYENGVLTAKSVWRAPAEAGIIEVAVEPEFDSPIKEYKLTKTITANHSQPATIKLEPSTYGFSSNFISEVKITGYLKNASGNFVSLGNSVLFEDFLLTGDSALGKFRDAQLETQDSSKVSAYYSTIHYPIGTQITIKGTVLDENGLTTSIKDSIILTINQ